MPINNSRWKGFTKGESQDSKATASKREDWGTPLTKFPFKWRCEESVGSQPGKGERGLKTENSTETEHTRRLAVETARVQRETVVEAIIRESVE